MPRMRQFDVRTLSLTVIVTNVPSKVRNCAEPPEHLRSEISFLCTCNIPNVLSNISCTALPTLQTLYWVSVDTMAQWHAH